MAGRKYLWPEAAYDRMYHMTVTDDTLQEQVEDRSAMTQKKSRFPAAFLISIILVLLDQYTKYLAVKFLKPGGPVSLIPGVLELRYLENRGAAFGILQNRQWIFIVFAFSCIIFCGWYGFRLARDGRHTAIRICLAFLAAGAAGNLIDRMTRGFVVDYIYFSLINFPVFNLADTYVSLSAIALIILVIFVYKDEED